MFTGFGSNFDPEVRPLHDFNNAKLFAFTNCHAGLLLATIVYFQTFKLCVICHELLLNGIYVSILTHDSLISKTYDYLSLWILFQHNRSEWLPQVVGGLREHINPCLLLQGVSSHT